MITNKKISGIINLIILYCFLASARACMTFGENLWVEFGAAVICIFYFSSEGAIKFSNSSIIASLLLLVSSIYYIHGGSFAGYVSKAMLVSLAVVLINLKDSWKIELFQTLSKWFGILLGLSIFWWLLHFIIPLPSVITLVDFGNTQIHTQNYFIFRETLYKEYNTEFLQRFQGMFLEPGHLGTISALFLVINSFDFKKIENCFFLIACILSLSASSYLIVALGYVCYRFTENGNLRLFITLLLLLGVILFFMNYNGGDNYINNFIFSKLTREDGAVEGRVSLSVLSMYENMLNSGNDLFFGKGWQLEDMDNRGAGIILFFVVTGVFGTVLLILAYYSIYHCSKSRYGLFIFIIYLVSFLQRTYPYWDAFTLPFILGLPFILKNKQLRTDEKKGRVDRYRNRVTSLFAK